MRYLSMALLGSLFVLAIHPSAKAQRRQAKLPDPAHGYDWKEVAQKHELGAREIEQLAKDKVLVTNQAFKQVFTPYLASDVPLFITSDSVLNGFHVLYEESVLRLEQANARKLGGILKFIWTNLETADKGFKGKPELVAAAKTRNKVLVATAMRLLGEDPGPLEGTLAALVKEEVGRVEAAKGQQKPNWLGPPDPGFAALDYTRYLPRGFYTKSPALQRYFRTVSWLQSIPFRVSKDEELVSILMLGNCVTYDRFRTDFKQEQDIRVFFHVFAQLLGPGDDWGLMNAAHEAQNVIHLDGDQGGLARVRKDFLQQATKYGQGPQINDQLAFAPDDPSQAAELAFRVIPAYRTPDAVCFQRTTDPRKFQRGLPSGLEVGVLLGSPYARSRLAAEEKGKLLAEIDRCKAFYSGQSLYCDYLRSLEPLLAQPEPDAPPFMSSVAWQIKSCQTALSGWAQLRHTWALQAKQSVEYLGLTETPPGFVEPVPEFFARMAALAEEAETVLREAGALATDWKEMASDIRAVVNLLEKKAVGKGVPKAFQSLSPDEMMQVSKLQWIIMALGTLPDEESPGKNLPKLLDGLRKLADDLEHGRPPTEGLLAEAVERSKVDIGDLWRCLGTVCRRLEALAHKQLRGAAFSEDENRFIRSYGQRLAAVMLYGGNSYLTPNDDAPRVVDVFSRPQIGTFLEVGIARPRALYVLYPVKSGEILCWGAVMPYFEFTHDARLTDAEWKALLDSVKRPKSPDWLSPIIVPSGLSAPTLKQDH